MAGLLDGVTVLDLSSVGPAARASSWLGDYGASVVKVGPVASRADSQVVPPAHAYSGGRGTRRLSLDLKSTAGRETFLRACAHADVVIESFRPGVVSRLGIGYDDAKGHNARLVYCSTTGYGQTGPRAQWAGHDLDYLAVGGFLGCSEPGIGGKPPVPGATVADSAGGGLHAALAIVAALFARERTGEGCYLDVSVSDGVLALMALQLDEFLATGEEPRPGTTLLTGRFACYDTYPTGDGRWLAVAAIEGKFWANLCNDIGLQEWIDKQYDDEQQPAIRRALTEVFATRSRDEWVDRLAAVDTCVAPVLSVAEAAQAAPTAEATTTDGARFRQLAPLLAGAQRADRYLVPDSDASDCDELLGGWGFDREEIGRLRMDGVVA